jgi:hypothetical protein
LCRHEYSFICYGFFSFSFCDRFYHHIQVCGDGVARRRTIKLPSPKKSSFTVNLSADKLLWQKTP